MECKDRCGSHQHAGGLDDHETGRDSLGVSVDYKEIDLRAES